MSLNLNRRPSHHLRAVPVAAVALAFLAPLAGGLLRAQSPADVTIQSGMEWLAKNQYRQAEEAFRKALAMDPGNFRALRALAESLLAQGRAGEAIQLLQEEAPNRTDVQKALGNTAVRAGEYDLAIDVFQKILTEIDANSKAAGDIYLRLGETYRRKGDLPSATAALRQARNLLPGNPFVLNTLATVLDASGQHDAAQAAYSELLAIDPNNGVALNNLAFLLSKSPGGDLDEALNLAQRAQALLPGLAQISDTLGWIYLKKNLSNQAIAVFDEAVKKEPTSSTFHYHLAMALAQKGDRFAAAEQLRTALTYNPSQEERQKIQQLLDSLQ